MRQQWRKLGLIYCPTGDDLWQNSHAAVPIAEHLEADLFKIYFSSRNAQNQSVTSYLILDINYPQKILQRSAHPILVPGDIGEFDDSGAMATWLAKWEGKRFLYYIGWNLGVTVPFRNSIGLSTSVCGEKYERYFRGPILDRSALEPHFVASCCVIPGDDKWRMWYLSCTDWIAENSTPKHKYHIKYAESRDGIIWERQGIVAIDYLHEGEYAISRPSVIRDNDCWKMWYSYRGIAYRIGYAESEDGIKWERQDANSGIDVSESGWDSEMIEYPFVFDHKGTRFMLYNGNRFGQSGFGLAVLEH